MNDKHKRSLRRYHRARKQQHARKVMHGWFETLLNGYFSRYGWHGPAMSKEEFHARVSKHRDNLAICSCSGCCSPRRNPWLRNKEKLTLQERRNLDMFEDDMEETVAYFDEHEYASEAQE